MRPTLSASVSDNDATRAEIIERLHNLNTDGRTIIMVTHELEITQQAKRQINVRDRVVADTSIFPGNAPKSWRQSVASDM